MKILFVSAASSVHTVRWVNALSARGHEVVLVSQKNHREDVNNISEKVKVRYLPFSGTIGYYFNAFALRSIYQKEEFDVVNVHYASGYGTLARIARLPDIILNVWGSDVYSFPYQSKAKERILRKNLQYAAQLASTSYSMAEQTKKFIGQQRDIVVTPFGIDITKFKKTEKKEVREQFVFGTVKTLSHIYGIDVIIEAFDIFLRNILNEEKKNIKLEVYGGGELLNELKMLAEAKGIGEQVHFGGYVNNNQVPDVLNEMDAFLLGSRRESFGVAALEAMACELPVIATKVSGFEEVMEDGKTGFLVPVDDTEEMARYMLELYKDERLRGLLGRAGRVRVEKIYDWEKNVEEMEALYLKNCGGHKR